MNVKAVKVAGLCLGLSITLACGVVLAQGVTQAWVARYNGLGNGKDHAQTLMLDSAGGAYVTGFSDGGGGNYDFATVKYDADGKQLWVARYDGPSQGADWAKALALDPAGSVVVAGSSTGEGTGLDFATVKYDSDGNQLWVRRYDGPAQGDDRLKALAVDAEGNVFAAGDSPGDGGRAESLIIKYDRDGELLWSLRSGLPGVSRSLAAIAVDDEGNVYATGSIAPRPRHMNFVTTKYDPQGNELWAAYHDWSANDFARYLVLDDWGNLYVAGDLVSGPEGTDGRRHQDFAIVKYGTDGKELWSKAFDGGKGSDDVVAALQLGPHGSVYLAANSLPAESDPERPATEYITLRYEADGNSMWLARNPGPQQTVSMLHDLAVDTLGNRYLMASSRGAPKRQPTLTIIGYNPQGDVLWTTQQEGLMTTATPGLSLDAAGNLWLAGTTADSEDYLVVNYSLVGATQTSAEPATVLTPGVR